MTFQKIINVKKIGISRTLDLEVDHKDHNFYAGGVVVSNSHAIGYASLSAITIYLKYRYPKEFFLACLNQAKNFATADTTPLEVISKIQRELNDFGIKLVGPHLVKSDMDFKIHGNEIIYGLKTIKSISETTLEKVKKFQSAYPTKVECLIAAKQAGLNIQQVCSLIQSGCLDGFSKSRCRFVLEAQTYNILSDKEKNLVGKFCEIAQNNGDILLTIKWLTENKDEKGKEYIKSSRFETIKKKYDKYKKMFLENSTNEALCNFLFEKNLLGFSYSNSLKNIFSKKYTSVETIKEIGQYFLDDAEVSCVGFITDSKYSKSKNNKFYLKFDIEDETGSTTVLCFKEEKIEEFLAKNKDRELKGEILVVRGTKKADCIFAKDFFIQETNVFMKTSELE